MDFQAIIAKRRDAQPHTQEELAFLAQGAAEGLIPDYQLAAWLMAAVLNPLTPQETAWLTLAMARSGQVLLLSGLPKPWIDKHSTGGVGDKTSLVLLPLLASCGITVIKMSGRGLGITGGTVDKLESIPGFRMDLSPAELLDQARRIGIAVTGPTAELAPADKALYSLRDATATVRSIPLIVSSILSKKIAGGAETVVLDVKCGSGGFMPTLAEAEELAKSLRETAELCGLKTAVAITDMSQPLGRCVGNALEVKEASEVLNGDLAGRFPALCIELAARALFAAERATTLEECRDQAAEALKRGLALEKASRWLEAQGASPAVLSNPELLPAARHVEEVLYFDGAGWISRLDAQTVGQAALDLGAGRKTKEDPIDHAVGIEALKELGSPIRTGDVLFRIHSQTPDAALRARERLLEAVQVLPQKIVPPPLIIDPLLPQVT